MVVDPWLGTELAGYRIEALIGRGGAGTVYRSTHLRLKRAAALKLLNPALAGDAEYRTRFEREARAAAVLDHPHIVPIYDAGHERDVLYLAMRHINGPDLGTVLTDQRLLTPRRACELLTGIAEALDSAHRAGLVHRDVKPANVLIEHKNPSTGPTRAYLCDFGIARHTSSTSALTTTQFVGTLQYCAPEQIQGHPLDGRADQYALACVAYHCLTGELPYPADEPSAVMFAQVSAEPPRASAGNPDLPTAVDNVINRAMAKEPADRYPDCAAFLRALSAATDGRSETNGTTAAGGRSEANGTGATDRTGTADGTSTTDGTSTAGLGPSVPPVTNPAVPPSPNPAGPHTMIWPPRPVGAGTPHAVSGAAPANPAPNTQPPWRRKGVQRIAAAAVVALGWLVFHHTTGGDTPPAAAPTPALAPVITPPAVPISKTHPVVSTVPIPTSHGGWDVFTGGIAVSPDGGRVYSVRDGSVAVIDTSRKAVIATIPVPGVLQGDVAVSPDGRYAYVTNQADGLPVSNRTGQATGQSLTVIDTERGSVAATIELPGVSGPVVLTPNGRSAYVVVHQNDQYLLVVIDTGSRSITTTSALPSISTPKMSMAPDGGHIYLGAGVINILVIDTATNNITATVKLPDGAINRVASTPDGQHAYATGYTLATKENTQDQRKVWKVDMTGATTATIPMDFGTWGIAVAPDGSAAYVMDASLDQKAGATEYANTLRVIDTTSNTVIDTLPLPSLGVGGSVAITPDGHHLYIAATACVLAIDFGR